MTGKIFIILLVLILFHSEITIRGQDDEGEQLYTEQYDEETPSPDDTNKIYTDIMSGDAPRYNLNLAYSTYNKKIRPGKINGSNTNVDASGSLIIKAMVSMRQLISLDEKIQVLTSSFYLLLKWSDPRLSWDSASYKNIKKIIVPANDFWLPDIAFINSASAQSLVTYQPQQYAMISNDGSMYLSLNFPAQQTRCKLDVYTYPFDTQECQIVIGSWAFDSIEFNFEALDVSTESYLNHPIWSLEAIKLKTIINRNRFALVNQELARMMNKTALRAEDLQIKLTLKRNPLYIMINGIFPCFVLNLVILVAFGVPYAQQVALCMTSFLTFVMCSVRISNDIPAQAEYLPLITLYFLLSILYTFIGFAWFIGLEILSKQKSLHPALILLAKITKKCLFCFFPSEAQPKKIDVKENISTVENPKSNENIIKPSPKCNFCNRCDECANQMQKEKKAKQTQADLNSHVKALNYLAWILLFLLIFGCNTAIWINIGVK